MRSRKLAGLVVGALAAGVMVAPGLVAPAQAAPTTQTKTVQLSCTFGNFKIAYPAAVALEVDGTAVSATLSDIPPTGMPAFLKVHGSAAVVDATVNGEAVELDGAVTYAAPVTNNPPIALPEVSGTRTGTADLTAFSVNKIDVTMTVQAGGPNTSESKMSCLPVVALTNTQNLTCIFGAYSIPYTAELTAGVAGTGVTGTLAKPFVPGMPAFVTVSKLSAVLNTTIDGAAVALSGSESYDPARAGNGSFTVPALSGARAAATPPSALAITGAVLTVTAMGSDNVINCTPAAAATTTKLGATSSAAGKVALAASVSPTGAVGNVEFYEGATKVGQAAATAGAASVALSTVSAGSHTYTAKFIPTDATKFGPSTSAPATVTVAVAPACTTATANAKAAQTKVKAAEAKVKKDQAKVKKAKAKVKKAKGNKQLKAAKKALKAAKKALKADTKKLSTAKKALTAANNAVKAAC